MLFENPPPKQHRHCQSNSLNHATGFVSKERQNDLVGSASRQVAAGSSFLRSVLPSRADLRLKLERLMLRIVRVVSAHPKCRRIPGGLQLESREEHCAIGVPTLRRPLPKETEAQLAAAGRASPRQLAVDQAARLTEFPPQRLGSQRFS